MTKTDRSFSKVEDDQFQQFVEQLRTKATIMTDAEFAMSIAEAAAITNNGHTNVNTAHMVDTLNSLPLRFFWFADGLPIVRAHANHADLDR